LPEFSERSGRYGAFRRWLRLPRERRRAAAPA